MMNFRSLLAAAAIAFMPAIASAAVIPIFDDGTTLIDTKNDDVFVFTVDTGASPGDWRHTFTLTNDGTGAAQASLTTVIAGLFTGLTMEWVLPDTTVVASGTPVPIGAGLTSLAATTVFTNPDTLSQTLVISWDDAGGAPDFDGNVKVSLIPVPASLLLLGTALGGLGVARRRKKKVA